MAAWTAQETLYVISFMIGMIWFIQFLWYRRKLYLYSWNIPGPFCLPLIGLGHRFLGGDPADIMDVLHDVHQNFIDEPLIKVWFGPRLLYMVLSPEHIEKILTHPKAMNKDILYQFLSEVIGTGLMTAPDLKWRRHRKTIMPSFNQKILDSFVDIFSEQSIIFADQLEQYVGKKDMDLFLLISRCTLDIICETAMGVKMNNQAAESDFGRNMDKIMEIVVVKIFQVWYHVDLLWMFSPLCWKLKKYTKHFKDFTASVVRKKMEEHEKKKLRRKSSLVADIDEKIVKRMAFLDLILENSSFTEEELQEEVNIFLIAGTDTTASYMCCLFSLLGMYQDVQQKIYEEVIDLIGPDRPVQPEDLPGLKYTERVIKEGLRLFPVASFFLRYIGEDIELGNNVTIPKGASAFFGSVEIHRNPNYWKDPLKFDPDRFLPEEIAKRHPCSYIPFSFGPRNCIGGRYAMMNIKTIVSTVIRKYRIFCDYKSIEEIKLKSNIVVRLKDGPKVRIELR